MSYDYYTGWDDRLEEYLERNYHKNLTSSIYNPVHIKMLKKRKIKAELRKQLKQLELWEDITEFSIRYNVPIEQEVDSISIHEYHELITSEIRHIENALEYGDYKIITSMKNYDPFDNERYESNFSDQPRDFDNDKPAIPSHHGPTYLPGYGGGDDIKNDNYISQGSNPGYDNSEISGIQYGDGKTIATSGCRIVDTTMMLREFGLIRENLTDAQAVELVAQFALDNGFRIPGGYGTESGFEAAILEGLSGGVYTAVVSSSKDDVESALKSGAMVNASVAGDGNETFIKLHSKHVILLAGIDNGIVDVRNPSTKGALEFSEGENYFNLNKVDRLKSKTDAYIIAGKKEDIEKYDKYGEG